MEWLVAGECKRLSLSADRADMTCRQGQQGSPDSSPTSVS